MSEGLPSPSGSLTGSHWSLDVLPQLVAGPVGQRDHGALRQGRAIAGNRYKAFFGSTNTLRLNQNSGEEENARKFTFFGSPDTRQFRARVSTANGHRRLEYPPDTSLDVSVYGDVARRARVRKSAVTDPRVIVRDRRMNCYNPYIGNWKHGYPRDDDSC